MKFIAIVGTNASKSYNRRLLHFMKKHFAAKAEIVIKEIKEYPLFCEDFDETPHSIMELATEIDHSDGVIFATPEYDHGIPAALKSVIEWLSYDVHPLTNRPVMAPRLEISARSMPKTTCAESLIHRDSDHTCSLVISFCLGMHPLHLTKMTT